MLPRLDDLMQYRHPLVLRAYVRNHVADEPTANALWDDMLRYLWICERHRADRKARPDDSALDFTLVMHQEMRDIDNMWHNFILYTHDYTQFCQRYFGEYLHHVPDVADTMVQTEREFETDMEKYLSYVYDQLGEATVTRWFAAHLGAEA